MIHRLNRFILAVALLIVSTSAVRADSPVILSVDPDPTNYIVDGSSLSEVTITFDQDVVIPAGAITARLNPTECGTPAQFLDVTVMQNTASTATVTFDAVSDQRLTLVIDSSVGNAGGELLDGEIDDPRAPTLPSGNGIEGGDAAFQISVLAGDVNRDGVVNIVDVGMTVGGNQVCDDDPNFNPMADLNGDGCINQSDFAIAINNISSEIPGVGDVRPSVAMVTSGCLPLVDDEFVVTFNEPMDARTMTGTSVLAIDSSDMLVLPDDAPTTTDDTSFTYTFTLTPGEFYRFYLSNSISDAW